MDQRERILRTTFALITKLGFTSVTMDYVAKECGISKRTLYENFSDKKTLTTEAINLISHERRDQVEDVIVNAPTMMHAMLGLFTIIRGYMMDTCHSFFVDMDRLYPSVAEAYRNIENAQIEGLISLVDKGKEQGVFLPDIKSEIIVFLNFSRSQKINIMETPLGNKYSALDIYETMFIAFIRGIATEKGMEIVEKYFKDKN
ncbi:MAG: TetR/AcrR family transcriptional regulator [Bacteroidales bacterium]